jgi:type IV secretion system protein VirD4
MSTRVTTATHRTTHRAVIPPLGGSGRMLWILALSSGIALWVATQYTAHAWHHHPALGSPLISWGHDPIYPPYQVLAWAVRYHHNATAIQTLRSAWTCGCIVFGGSVVSLVVLTPSRETRRPSTAHGTARWGVGETVRHPTGLLLGRLGNTPLRYHGDGHLVTVAPTRSGKGVSAIIPNLLTYPGSMVVTDPKGENYAVTARRRRELGTEVVAFDPFGLVGGTAACNPLDLVDVTTPDAVDDARLIADMLVVVDGKETGEHAFWNEEARALIAGLVLYVAAEAPPELRHLAHLRTLLTLPPVLFAELLDRMSASEAVEGLVARTAHRILQKADKERSGVISAAQSHTHFLDSARMTAVLSRSTIDVRQLKTTPTSIFLILPTDRLDGYQRYLRLMLAVCLHAVTRTRTPPAPSVGRIVFLVDEFGHLGRLRPIEQQIGLVGGYGASLWLFVQDFSQLKAVYAERWSTFVANADVLQAFGTNDWETAEYVSKMTGDATVFTDSENRSRGVSYGKHGSRQVSAAATLSERGRRLLLPDEVRRLPADAQVLFVKQSDPILASRLTYVPPHDRVSAALFAKHFDPNPMVHHEPRIALNRHA